MKYSLRNKNVFFQHQLYYCFDVNMANENIYGIIHNSEKIILNNKLDLGEILIFILNNYHILIERLKQLISENQELLSNFKDTDTMLNRKYCEYEFFIDNLLKDFEFLKNFDVYFIIYYIEYFLTETFRKHQSKVKDIEIGLNKKQKYIKVILEQYGISNTKELKKIYDELNMPNAIINAWITQLLSFEKNIKQLENIVNSAFAPSYENSKTNLFTGINIELPKPSIQYSSDGYRFPIPVKYTYKIDTLQDLFYVTIYHLSMEHKIIRKCQGCSKYFIPSRTNELFCSGDYSNSYYSKEVEGATTSKKFYRALKKRLFVKRNGVYNTRYEDERTEFELNYDYKTKRNEYIELYNGDMNKVEIALLKLYTNFDKKLQKKENTTKPCSTECYWIEH